VVGQEGDDGIVRVAGFLQRRQHRVDVRVDDRVQPAIQLQELQAVLGKIVSGTKGPACRPNQPVLVVGEH
jgi:hypothetical protein